MVSFLSPFGISWECPKSLSIKGHSNFSCSFKHTSFHRLDDDPARAPGRGAFPQPPFHRLQPPASPVRAKLAAGIIPAVIEARLRGKLGFTPVHLITHFHLPSDSRHGNPLSARERSRPLHEEDRH